MTSSYRMGDRRLDALRDLAAAYLRPPTGLLDDGLGNLTLAWDPPLTQQEQASEADLETMLAFGVQLTLAEWQSVKPDAALLRTYYQLGSPTAVQTAAAVKAIVHVLSVIIRS